MAWSANPTQHYDKESSEARGNVDEIYRLLAYASAWADEGYNFNWTLNAICALLGSVHGESKYNPWLWQNNYIPSFAEYQSWLSDYQPEHAYGLVQFDPSSDYIERSPNAYNTAHFSDRTGTPQDGEYQIKCVVNTMGEQWYDFTHRYPITFEQFATGNYSLYDLTAAWVLNYERPYGYDDPSIIDPEINARYEIAQYWYNILSGEDPPDPPVPPVPPTPTDSERHIKPWWYTRFIRR